MAKIHTLKIKNYRGIQTFEQVFGLENFICLIGRGDSGKTTILDAIASVLSPSWNLTFYDTDFFNCNVNNSIEIEASLYDLPKTLLQENKFGLHIQGLNKITNTIHDEIEDTHEAILTIRLSVDKDLEPKWFVVNGRTHQDTIEIRGSDRASLNVFLVSDYIDRHFSWNKGNPLYSLLNEDGTDDEQMNAILNVLREAKEQIDALPFAHLDGVVEKVKASATILGVDISKTSTTIDIRDISIKDGRISLHDEKIPFRLKGKGTKRLISIAIQMELSKAGGIILIDEIEQGLEPDRAQHLAQTLKRNNKGQIFITTHSRDVLVELQAENIFRMKKGGNTLTSFGPALQNVIRGQPEAFFSDKVLVCEGPTEVGICRQLNWNRIAGGDRSVTFQGVRLTNGNGSNQVVYAKAFLASGYSVCLFCDSDVTNINAEKAELREKGIKIIDCVDGNWIEKQFFEDLSIAGIKELINYRINFQEEDSIRDSVKSQFNGEFPSDWKNTDTKEMRLALSKASVTKHNPWFKRTDHGEFLTRVYSKYLDSIEGSRLKSIFEELSTWIGND